MPENKPAVNRDKILETLKSSYDGEKKRNITFSLPARLLDEFKTDCDSHGLKMNKVVQKILEDYLKG